MGWPRPAQRALALLVALLLAAAAWRALRPDPPAAAPAAGEPAPELRVDLNAADAPTLEAVPGIGPALAARIVGERARRGRFASVDDLVSVPGIGPKTLAALRPYLEVP